MKSVLEQQKSKIKWAVVNTGEYRRRAEYCHLPVESSWVVHTFLGAKKKGDWEIHKGNLTQEWTTVVAFKISQFRLTLKSLYGTKQTGLLVMTLQLSKHWVQKKAGGCWDQVVKGLTTQMYMKMSNSALAWDDQWLSYKSTNLCSHITALAIKTGYLYRFLRW